MDRIFVAKVIGIYGTNIAVHTEFPIRKTRRDHGSESPTKRMGVVAVVILKFKEVNCTIQRPLVTYNLL